ncbi:relaxase/mobilization nuclease [Streptomyces sp. ISL-12]|uniref:relaxase/mobilization nuclease n=1 Tax=Streptomyces sp. ISL-12 TaxID=2819177 RepID=UPI001BECA16F|nr:relaxase/mobilization nuclease [Streptomyces sp. ISL-12]MBT2409350.1 relaxase/mobilization nuclease [Streptomyces sp. ISL-12]
MIPLVHPRSFLTREALTDALGRPVSRDESRPEHTVVAHWPGLDHYTLDDEQKTWTAAQWAEHLQDPVIEHPFAASPRGDRNAVFHLDVRLHPDDRTLSRAEWAEIAHRLARVAGVQIPGDEQGCRWVAVQAQPGRLDVLANLIRLDGAWQQRPADFPRRLADAARLIERDLCLTSVTSAPAESVPFASVLSHLADERVGPLAAVRALVEHTAWQVVRQSDAGAGHGLELIARRVYDIQQDLDAAAARLTAQPRPPATAAPAPAAKSSARRAF